MRLATAAEVAGWDELVAANPRGGHIWQSREWGELKQRDGWRPAHWSSRTGTSGSRRSSCDDSFPPLGEALYCPKGPAIHDLAQPRRLMRRDPLFGPAFVLRVEPS